MNMIKAGHQIRVNDILLDTLVSTNYTSYTTSVLCYLLNEISTRYHNNCNKDGYLFREDRTITITEQESSTMLRYNVCNNTAKKIQGDNIQDVKGEVFTPGEREESIVTESDLAKVKAELQNNIFSYICATESGVYKIYIFSIIYCDKQNKEIQVTFNADFIEMYFGVLTANGKGQNKYSKLPVDVMTSLNKRRSQMLFGYITKYQVQLDKYGDTNWFRFETLRDILNVVDGDTSQNVLIYTKRALKDINKCMKSHVKDNKYKQYKVEYRKAVEGMKTSPYKYFKIVQETVDITTPQTKAKKTKATKEQQKRRRHNYFGDME